LEDALVRLLNAVVTTHLQEHMQVVVLDILVTTTLSVIVLVETVAVVVTTTLLEMVQVVHLYAQVTTTLSVIVLESIVLEEVTHYAVTITTL
jgi:hypothetical protein